MLRIIRNGLFAFVLIYWYMETTSTNTQRLELNSDRVGIKAFNLIEMITFVVDVIELYYQWRLIHLAFYIFSLGEVCMSEYNNHTNMLQK